MTIAPVVEGQPSALPAAPRPPPIELQRVRLAVGRHHTCVALPRRPLHCWGLNHLRQLGDGTTDSRLVPTALPGVDDVVAVALGSWHSCALRDKGSVWCWGANDAGQANGVQGVTVGSVRQVEGVPPAVAIAAGGASSCALVNRSSVYCWGSAAWSRSAADSPARPRADGPVQIPNIDDAVGIAVGGDHACALTGSGEVLCWGSNAQGQLGDGTTEARDVATRVAGLTAVVELAAGDAHTCARRGDGAVFCWGWGEAALGKASPERVTTPTRVDAVGRAERIVGGYAGTCAIVPAGRLRCWGQLNVDREPDLSNVVEVGLGEFHTCALQRGDRVLCWGYGTYGTIGDGQMKDRRLPVQVLP